MFVVSRTVLSSLDKYKGVRHNNRWLARVCRDRKRGYLVMYKWKFTALLKDLSSVLLLPV